MIPAIVADTGGLLRALARNPGSQPSFPDYENARALELDARFKEPGLGFVDGTVAAVAERRRVYRILTTARRDFARLRVGPCLSRPLELLP